MFGLIDYRMIGEDATEVYLGINWELLSLTIYQDMSGSTYLSLDLEHSVAGFDLAASLGDRLVLSAAYPMQWGGWTYTPSIILVDDYVVTGISISRKF